MAEKTIIIRQTRSGIGQTKRRRETLKALGLGKIGKTTEHQASPSTLGMIRQVAHMVEIVPQSGN